MPVKSRGVISGVIYVATLIVATRLASLALAQQASTGFAQATASIAFKDSVGATATASVAFQNARETSTELTIAFGNVPSPTPAPTIASISPFSKFQGETITDFTVNGANFQPTATLLFSGFGITIDSYSQRSLTKIVATIRIDPLAAGGLRDVTVMNPDLQQATRHGAFAVGGSSVAFLPGIEGSRLYTAGAFLEDQLWEPFTLFDLCALRPNADGVSSPDIYTRDVIDSAVGLFDIYGTFGRFMDELRSHGLLKDWRPFPYGWRGDIERIARGDVITGLNGVTQVSRLNTTISELAASSFTGKVTIVTHSNGGLLVKELIRFLIDQSAVANVDRIIMIAPPHLGTPSAISSLTHGDALVPWLGLGEAATREAADTMIGALNLLPSELYFHRVASPVIEFDPQAVGVAELDSFRRTYGDHIDTYGSDTTGLRGFLLGADGRTEPFTGNCTLAPLLSDTRHPDILKPTLLDRVRLLHNRNDSWQPPPNIRVFQVAGWGLSTLSGIRYTAEPICLDSQCFLIAQALAHRPLDTTSGDGTVVVPSATALLTDTFYFNLYDYNRRPDLPLFGARDHSNIMGASSILSLVSNLLDSEPNPSINQIGKSQPIGATRIRVILRSPVSLDAYDSSGRHTGLAVNQNPLLQFPVIERQIPNSSFERFGGEVYLSLDARDRYQLRLRGLDLSTFTLALEEYVDDRLTSTISFQNIPVSVSTRAVVDLQHVSTSVALAVDVNGDGITDFVIPQGSRTNPAMSLPVLAATIRSAGFSVGVTQSLTAKIDGAAAAFSRGNNQAAAGILGALIAELQAQRGKSIPPPTSDALIRVVRTLLRAFAV
jgi:hypothetical protein